MLVLALLLSSATKTSKNLIYSWPLVKNLTADELVLLNIQVRHIPVILRFVSKLALVFTIDSLICLRLVQPTSVTIFLGIRL